MRSRRKVATRSRDSPSCWGASLATCSISSLKLTAPALDLDAEHLADDAAQQTLQAGVVQRGQRPNRLLFVRLQQCAGSRLDAEVVDQRLERGAIAGIRARA